MIYPWARALVGDLHLLAGSGGPGQDSEAAGDIAQLVAEASLWEATMVSVCFIDSVPLQPFSWVPIRGNPHVSREA